LRLRKYVAKRNVRQQITVVIDVEPVRDERSLHCRNIFLRDL